jgi:hypothetical protein
VLCICIATTADTNLQMYTIGDYAIQLCLPGSLSVFVGLRFTGKLLAWWIRACIALSVQQPQHPSFFGDTALVLQACLQLVNSHSEVQRPGTLGTNRARTTD